MGLPPIESTTVLIESLNLPMTPQEYLAEAQSKLEERFVEADLMPGINCQEALIFCKLRGAWNIGHKMKPKAPG